MNRLALRDPNKAEGDEKAAFDAVKTTFGFVPNIFRLAANSLPVFQGLLSLYGALQATSLSPQMRAVISIAVAEINGCDYCLSAYSAIGSGVGLSPAALEHARLARSEDRRTDALVNFAAEVTTLRGNVSTQSLDRARSAGLTDQELVEVTALVAMNIMTNYLNNIAATDIDFPVVHAR